jgi:hypothetical protein
LLARRLEPCTPSQASSRRGVGAVWLLLPTVALHLCHLCHAVARALLALAVLVPRARPRMRACWPEASRGVSCDACRMRSKPLSTMRVFVLRRVRRPVCDTGTRCGCACFAYLKHAYGGVPASATPAPPSSLCKVLLQSPPLGPHRDSRLSRRPRFGRSRRSRRSRRPRRDRERRADDTSAPSHGGHGDHGVNGDTAGSVRET